MPISLYEGVPGGGKSYHAVKAVRDAVNQGREVWTNIDGLNVSMFSDSSLIHMMSGGEVQRPWLYLPKNSLCIIDEALMPFPDDFGKNEDTNQADVVDLKKWATQHRHDGQDIIMVVQDSWMLARVLRNVAAVRINYHNQGHLGFGKRCRIKYFSPCKERRPYKTENIRYDKDVFPLYQSVKEGSDLAATKGRNIFLSPFVIFPVLGLVVSFLAVFGLFGRYNDAASPQVKAVIDTPSLVSDAVASPSTFSISSSSSVPDPQQLIPIVPLPVAYVSGFSLFRDQVRVLIITDDSRQSFAHELGLVFTVENDQVFDSSGKPVFVGSPLHLTVKQFAAISPIDKISRSFTSVKKVRLDGDSVHARYLSSLPKNLTQRLFPVSPTPAIKSYTHGADGWVNNSNI